MGDPRRLSKGVLLDVTSALMASAVAVLAVGLFSIPAGAAQPLMSAAVNCTPLAGSTIGCPNPPTQPGGLDHFYCHPVQSDGFSPPLVDLTDQFGTHNMIQPLSASTTTASATDNQFCNPVIKTPSDSSGTSTGPVYGVNNPQAHLYCFSDPTIPAPTVQVSVTNQFGTGTLTLGKSTRLCLPSWKEDPNVLATNPLASGSVPPTLWTDPNDLNLNHFQCYQVASVAPGGFAKTPFGVTMEDQFGTEEEAGSGLFHPVELCAPVIKQVVDSAGTPVGGPSTINGDGVGGAHLLCVSVTAGGATHSISVGNQFSASPPSAIPNPTSVVVTTGAAQLCLPSFVSVIPPNDTPEVPSVLLLPLAGFAVGGGALVVVRRRRRLSKIW